MTFLELAQELRSLAGITGVGPTAVTAQVGEYARVVSWIRNAWIKIQMEREGKWKFLRSEFSKDTVSGTKDYEFYTTDGVSSFDPDSFFVYLKTDGANEKVKLAYMDYFKFRRTFIDFSQTGEPFVVTVTPDNKLRVYPTPDDVYTIEADAFDVPVSLAADADTPAMPAGFHMAIVYRALMDYGGYEEADPTFTFARDQYNALFNQMLWTQLMEPEEMVVRVM